MIKRQFKCKEKHKYWYEYLFHFHKHNSPHNSQHMFDVYSLTHLFHSMLLTLIFVFMFGKRHDIPTAVLLFKLIFEIYENTETQIKKYHRIEINSMGESSYYGDSVINIIGDMIMGIIGVYIAFNYNITNVIKILFMLFITITTFIGTSYWTDFMYFLIN